MKIYFQALIIIINAVIECFFWGTPVFYNLAFSLLLRDDKESNVNNVKVTFVHRKIP
jgi:hypothetical protein